MLLASLLAIASVTAQAASAPREEARALLKKGERAAALRKYVELASSSADAELSAEYALALASDGLPEAALWELDRALLLDATNDQVLYACSTLLAALGHKDPAAELARPSPGWVGGATLLAPGSLTRRNDQYPAATDYKDELVNANVLLGQARYATAVDRLARLTARHPREPMGWAAYSIALEKLGAYKTSARMAANELPLVSDADPETRALLTERQAELVSRPRAGPLKANEALKGMFTAYAGGGISRASGTTDYAFNLQAGKFVTDRLNLGVGTGYAKATDFSIGVTGRYHQPIPGETPVNLTGGARIDYVSSPSTFSILLSPGASYFIRESSIDAFLDVGVVGSQKGVVTFSLGYTLYFRGIGT
jgi:tetratricopeptide (TPR) repeat protein